MKKTIKYKVLKTVKYAEYALFIVFIILLIMFLFSATARVPYDSLFRILFLPGLT